MSFGKEPKKQRFVMLFEAKTLLFVVTIIWILFAAYYRGIREPQRVKKFENKRKTEALIWLSDTMRKGYYDRVISHPDLSKEALAILVAENFRFAERVHEEFLPYGVRDWVSSVGMVARDVLHEKSGFFPMDSSKSTIETLYQEINGLDAELKKHDPDLGLNAGERW